MGNTDERCDLQLEIMETRKWEAILFLGLIVSAVDKTITKTTLKELPLLHVHELVKEVQTNLPICYRKYRRKLW